MKDCLVTFLLRPIAGLLLMLACVLPAQAATYAFRSDTYNWETAANTVTSWDKGTCTGYPSDDDRVTVNFTGGFTFTFAGTAYSSVRILTNGALQFGADTGFFRTYTNTALPAGSSNNIATGCAYGPTTNVLMGYWTDLNPGATGSGTVTYEQKGTAPNRYFVVSYNAVYEYGTKTPYSLQIILYENGEFKYQYGNSNTTGSNATIGVQVSSSDYTQYSFDSGYNANGSAIRWFVASGAPSRVANYRFDEFSYSGTVGEIVDASGNSHNGTAVGGVQTTANGYVCRALDIPANTTGTIQAADTALSVNSLLGADGSVSMWFRSNVVWTSSSAATLFDATTVSNRPFYLERVGGGALKFSVADTSGTLLTATTAAQTFPASTWVHVAVSWRLASGTNASVLRIYVNGVQAAVANGTTNGNLDSSIGTLFLGDNRSSVTPSGGTLSSANGAIDEVSVYNYEISSVEIAADMSVSHSCSNLHHIELRGSATGLTCTPTTWTVAACQDSACTVGYSGGVTGTLAAATYPSGGAAMTVNWPAGTTFSIPSGASTSTLDMQQVTAGSVTMSAAGVSPSPSGGASTCTFGSPSCVFTASDSGLVFSVPNHLAEAAQSVTVGAVKKSDSSTACVPAFASVTKSVAFSCSYVNPSSGTLPVRVGGVALNSAGSTASACDASGKAVSLAFNSSGVATTTLQYADVGQVTLTGKYTGSGSDAGLTMTGSSTFIAAPASFGFSGISASPSAAYIAGSAFSATVTAKNSSGAATPNFGKEATPESVSVVFNKAAPTGANAAAGSFGCGGSTSTCTFSGFSGGSSSSTSLVWTEVGTGDLVGSLASAGYLGTSGASALVPTAASTGSAGAVGAFRPDHFVLQATSACSGGATAFTYSGQPFTLTVTARNALKATTQNYDGTASTTPNYAKNITLSDDAGLAGAFATAAFPLSSFVKGVATISPSYAFTAKQTAPGTLKVGASDGTVTVSASSVSAAEDVPASRSTLLRSGRLRMSNAFGSEKSSLGLPVQAEYWTGSSWLPNSDDSCTNLPTSAVARSNVRDGKGNAATWTNTVTGGGHLGNGKATITLSAPSPSGSTGTADIAFNLGSTAADQACLGTHPATTGAALSWLRSQFGSCASTWDRDPSARASFGVYTPESTRTVHAREIF